MSISENAITTLTELADGKYRANGRTNSDLLQCIALYQEALTGAVELYGANSEHTGYILNAMGLVYHEMDDHFDEGERAFETSATAYKSAPNRSIVMSNHGDLLMKKGKLIEEEIADMEEDLRKENEAAANQPKPQPKRRDLQSVISGLLRFRQKPATTPEVTPVYDLAADLRETKEELTAVYRKASQLKAKALELKAAAAKEANSRTSSEIRDTRETRMSDSRAVAVYQRPENKAASPTEADSECASPAKIFAALDEIAIGQRAAKRGLANAASQHMKRMKLAPEERAKTDKSNVLIMGPTGCGKTLLAEGLARIINVAYYRTEATKLTASGYVGEDVQSVLAGLLKASNYDVERAQKGIIFIDEIDKKAGHGGGNLDVGGSSVQQELLTILEGTKISVPKDGNNKTKGEYVEIDTTDILFIVGGAFVGLGEIVKSRVSSKSASIGFCAELRSRNEDPNSYLNAATAEDFIKFGMIPEFIGRLPKRLYIETLTVEQLERILTEPKKAILRQKRLLLEGTTDLRFTRSALRAVAEEAHAIGTNGRALREIVEQVLEPIVFTEPKEVVITEEMVRNRRLEVARINKDEVAPKAPQTPEYIIDDEAMMSEETRTAARTA